MEITNGTQFFKDSGSPNRNGKLVVLLDSDGRPEQYLSVSAPGEVQFDVNLDQFWTYEDLPDEETYLCCYMCVENGKVHYDFLFNGGDGYYDNSSGFHDFEKYQVIAYCKQLPEVKG